MAKFSHLNDKDQATMVNVGDKPVSKRMAKVCGSVKVSKACAEELNQSMVLEINAVARVAGLLAAKKTGEFIPHCHQVQLDAVHLDLQYDGGAQMFRITAESHATGKTGVEMEAFVACSTAALTIYDMTKALDPEAVIGPLYLAEKTGGKLGHWVRGHTPC